MLKKLEQWIFPSICCLCRQYSKTNRDLCENCWHSLPWIEDRCYGCGERLETGEYAVFCEACSHKTYAFDRLCALFSYEPPVTQLIADLKFNKRLVYGKVLGEVLANKVMDWYQDKPLPEALLPVPLYKERLQKRGFNQSLELLWPLYSKPLYHLGKIKEIKNIKGSMPILLDECVRVRKTSPQAQMDKAERKKNLKDAFKIVKPIHFEHIAIVDDVVTTGSTVHAISEVLKESSVMQIDIWCICRA